MEAPKKIAAKHRLWDWLASLILICAVFTSASRLSSTRWVDEQYVVQTVAILSVLIGLVLGRTRFSPREFAFVAIAYGTLIVFWQLARLIDIKVDYKVRLEVLSSRVYKAIQLFFQGEKVSDAFWFARSSWVVSETSSSSQDLTLPGHDSTRD